MVRVGTRNVREPGERLKERVLEDIFPHFARGFIIHARRSGLIDARLEEMESEQCSRLLEAYFNGTLIFLYRLLFVLYVESRDLLPVREVHGYYPKSLEKLKRQVAGQAGTIVEQAPGKISAAYHELSTALYDGLQELFLALDRGDANLNIPAYNAGLFITWPDLTDPSPRAEAIRFLAEHKIPDRQLALGLDRLVRDIDEKRHELVFIDYKSLDVRQLGNIYEGLLEFKLRVAPADMAVVKGKRTIVPYAEAEQKKLPILKAGRGKYAHAKTYPKGTVYLENDRRERRATGSYYTPGYIVKYIVENTVGPVLKEKLEALRPIFHEAEQTLAAERNEANALRKQAVFPKGDTPENETYKKYRSTLNVSFFDLKVLDPAMGSGHFLVEAVNYIADQMAQFLAAFKWNPIVHELAETRRAIQKEMERQGLTLDTSKLTGINLLKRHVLKRCIYGVDLNPMAVELAKVSLWLDCFTPGARLPFLDHHLRVGNALIGGNVQEVQDILSTWGNQFAYLLNATELVRRASELADITAQEIVASREAYQEACETLAPFKRLLDVWISPYFGNKALAVSLAGALELARTNRFFHWELEFPDVFYDATRCKEKGGFDAVVGNPPYVSAPAMVTTMPVERKFLEGRYKLLTMKWDVYCAFLELSCRELRENGAAGLIVPGQVLYQDYARLIRKELSEKYTIEHVADFSRVRVFTGATVMTCVIIARKSLTQQENHLVKTLKPTAEGVCYGESFLPANHILLPQSAFSQTADRTFRLEASDPAVVHVGEKLSLQSYSLGDICYGSVGVVPHSEKQGKPKQHYIFPYRHDATCKPYIEGKEVDRYEISWHERFLQYDYNVVRRPSLPELLDSVKIILKIVAGKSGLHATIDYAGFYGDHSFVMLTQKYRLTHVKSRTLLLDQPGIELSKNYQLEFLLAIMNSSLMGWYFQKNLSSDLNIGPDDVKKLPIRRISFTTPPQERARLLEKAKDLYTCCMTRDDLVCVPSFVDHCLSQEPEESDVVHDLLAWLAQEMIRLNQEKWAITKEFLDWLVTTFRIVAGKDGRPGINALTGKGRLMEFAGNYRKGEPPLAFGDLVEILRKNKGKLGVRLDDAGNGGLVNEIEGRYEESLGRVLPVKAQLRMTDRLIDQVVYRLYGLTGEEIEVVERG